MSVLINGCAHREYNGPQQPELLKEWVHWSMSASIKATDTVSGKTMKGRVRWKQCDDNYDMRVLGPFNITVMRLFSDEHGVTLHRFNKEPRYSTSAEQLSKEMIGVELAISSFPYWLKGVFAPAAEVSDVAREAGRLLAWRQGAWRIKVASYRGKTGLLLPERLVMQSGADVIEWKIGRWREQDSCA